MSLESRFRNRLILVGDQYSRHTIERYHRKWRRDGRIYRDRKIAIQLAEYDEQTVDRLGTLDWDEYHCTYDPDHSCLFADEAGAWTLDATEAARDRLDAFGIVCPPLEDLPLSGKVSALSLNGRECPACESESICSSRDLDAFPSWTDDMEIARESVEISHICMNCRRWFEAGP